MPKRYYDIQNHCCSACGMLCDILSFRAHTETECFMIEMKNMQLKEKIEKFKNKKEVEK